MYHVKDPAHASRRLVSKPWLGDPAIERVLQVAIVNKTKLICCSDDIKRISAENASTIENSSVNASNVRDLQYGVD